jgi:hypothetical protein
MFVPVVRYANQVATAIPVNPQSPQNPLQSRIFAWRISFLSQGKIERYRRKVLDWTQSSAHDA